MQKFRNTRRIFVLLLVVVLMATTASAALAGNPGNGGEGKVDLKVLHRINGEELGLDKALPVDVCVNGEFAFTFEFGDTVDTTIPSGEYKFEVFLKSEKKCEGDPVLSAGPVFLPKGSKVVAKAAILAGEPVLAVKIYEKKQPK